MNKKLWISLRALTSVAVLILPVSAQFDFGGVINSGGDTGNSYDLSGIANSSLSNFSFDEAAIDVLSENIGGQFGISPEAVEIARDVINGNINLERFATDVFGDILEDNCPVEVMHVVAGACGQSERLERPVAIEIDADNSPRTSGGLRRNSQPQTDVLSPNIRVKERDLANLYDREAARVIAYDYLGETGDEWLLSNINEDQALIEGSKLIQKDLSQLTFQAQNLTVTQDVMKNAILVEELRSQMAVNQTILEGKTHASLLALQQQNASVIELSANLSDSIDESNRARRLERNASALNALNTPTYLPGFDLIK